MLSLASAQIARSGAATASVSSASNPAPIQNFLAGQKSLVTDFQSLIAQGASSDQIKAWIQQNSDRIAQQGQALEQLSLNQSNLDLNYLTDIETSANISQNMDIFLTSSANLFNLRAQIYNQQLQGSGTVDQGKVQTVFLQQNSAAIQTQAQQAQVCAQEAEQQPIQMPAAMILPPGASSQLQAYLTLRDQLMREMIRVHNQNLSLSSTARQAAVQKWQQANSNRLAQLQSMSQAFTSTVQN